MRIRDLKRRYGSVVIDVWPPLWTSVFRPAGSHPTGDQARDEGVLESVERLGDRLTMRMRFSDRVHLGSLEWDEPPTAAEVEAVLLANLGKPIGRIGDLEV
jgi:hypothetical protein